MPILPDCLGKVGHDLKDYLDKTAKVHLDAGLPEKDAYIKAAREIQNKNLDNLHNAYHQAKVEGYENPIERGITPTEQTPTPDTKQAEGVSNGYDEIQKKIDNLEVQLEKEGKSQTRMFDPSEHKKSDFPEGYEPMPKELADLYKQRFEIENNDRADITDSISKIAGFDKDETEELLRGLGMSKYNSTYVFGGSVDKWNADPHKKIQYIYNHIFNKNNPNNEDFTSFNLNMKDNGNDVYLSANRPLDAETVKQTEKIYNSIAFTLGKDKINLEGLIKSGEQKLSIPENKKSNEQNKTPELPLKAEVKKQEPTKVNETGGGASEKYPTQKEFKNADQVVSHLDAQQRLSNGERIFAIPEMDETPIELKNAGELEKYAPDQLIAIKRKENPFNETGKGAEPPKGNEPEVEGGEGKEPEVTKIANAVNDELIKGKFGVDALDGIIDKLQDTDLSKTYGAIKDRVQKGTLDPKVTRDKVLTQKSGNATDQAVLLYDMAHLKGQEKDLRRQIIESTDPKEKDLLQRQLVDAQNNMMDNALANRYIGRDWHNIGKIRQQWINKDFNIVDMQNEYMAGKGISELTPNQKAEVQKFHDTIKDLEAQRDKAKEDLDKAITENEGLKMENLKLQELKDKATNQKRADRGKKSEDAVKKSEERIQKAKEELKRLRGNINVGFDPRAAVQITKIAAEYTYQGVVKLSELVKQVLDTVKDVFPDWTEKDVRQHLFGEGVDTEKYFEAGKKYDTSSKELQEKIRNYNDLQKQHALKMFEWQKDRRSDIMAKRPFKERAIDGILRWQRFAVLTWPPTIAKLIAVVGHQVILKPIKFLVQKVIANILPKNITEKQQVWGNPTWRSLGKYYSEFVRNFSLANLTEQFSGIDTKEILYGDSYKYDEWAAAKGLLEMPGRSHGYIKSFIKNPEFKFAQENIATHYISKMAEIESQLKDDKLTESEKDKLKDEYSKWDITDPDVMERVNKLSLEHGKWAIFMNDSKVVKGFQNFADKKSLTGLMLRSELPIVKIPVNYVSRSFATKYGLIKAITGSKWMGGNLPSMFEMIYKGTKDMTPEQADLLGKTLTLGTMGASFFAMGYLMRSQIKQNDDGSYTLFGKHIPKLFLHSPELESVFNGAETGNSFDKKGKSGKDISGWLNSYVEADINMAKNNPFLGMLKYGFLPNVAMTVLKKESWDKKKKEFADEVGKKISDLTIPGVAKYVAQGEDNKKGFNWEGKSDVYRKSTSPDFLNRVLDGIETNIPGVRENVPVSERKTIGIKDTENGIKRQATWQEYKDYQEKGQANYSKEMKRLKNEDIWIDKYGDVSVTRIKNKDGTPILDFKPLAEGEEKMFSELTPSQHKQLDDKIKKQMYGWAKNELFGPDNYKEDDESQNDDTDENK